MKLTAQIPQSKSILPIEVTAKIDVLVRDYFIAGRTAPRESHASVIEKLDLSGCALPVRVAAVRWLEETLTTVDAL